VLEGERAVEEGGAEIAEIWVDFATAPLEMPEVRMGSLTSLTTQRAVPSLNGMRTPPALGGSWRRILSANCASMRCSCHICVTDSKVCLNDGTTRTFVRWNLTVAPVASTVITGMSPIAVHLTMRPLASPKISSHFRWLMTRRVSGRRRGAARVGGGFEGTDSMVEIERGTEVERGWLRDVNQGLVVGDSLDDR
jgi:hypothetical protein